jgi:diaminohydroxyphosphoribosylaminopyrimidine deaminase/5-amino-6-(5-phosphoribosylamino)uracil reductase
LKNTTRPDGRRYAVLHPTELILTAGIPRVVLAWREPSIFVDCEGVELLTAAKVEVLELPDLADEVKSINDHLLG